MKTKLWQQHHHQWRDPLEIISQTKDIPEVDPQILMFQVKGQWWNLLERLKIRLLVSREYEHLMLALGCSKQGPEISYMGLPHPSGIAVDHTKKQIYIAATRNPNQVYTFSPAQGLIPRKDMQGIGDVGKKHLGTLLPKQTAFYPGSLYIHDLAMVDGKLYANAVGHNAVVELLSHGGYRYAWWPRCVDHKNGPIHDANYLQLNSIAAGKNIKDSYFSASADQISSRRPGHVDFPVDGRGIIFLGKTREPICEGLTRPHSARLYQGKLWVDNSGYGEFGFVNQSQFQIVTQLPGWTRGLYFHKEIAFVGISRVIPRFYRYAPGLDVKKSFCGICAIDVTTGKVLGQITWPNGNQIFAIEGIPNQWSKGFLHQYRPKRNSNHTMQIFYAFKN